MQGWFGTTKLGVDIPITVNVIPPGVAGACAKAAEPARYLEWESYSHYQPCRRGCHHDALSHGVGNCGAVHEGAG